MNAATPSELQLDALREVANIGCGHAVNALSRLVGNRKVQLDVPRVLVAQRSQMPAMVGEVDSPTVAAQLGMAGELTGQLLLVLSETEALHLCSLMLGRACADTLDSNAESALGEAANIVASACLTAIGTLTGLRLLPSIPALMRGPAGQVVASAVAACAGSVAEAGLVVVLEARFQSEIAPLIGGRLLVLPEQESLTRLLAKLGV